MLRNRSVEFYVAVYFSIIGVGLLACGPGGDGNETADAGGTADVADGTGAAPLAVSFSGSSDFERNESSHLAVIRDDTPEAELSWTLEDVPSGVVEVEISDGVGVVGPPEAGTVTVSPAQTTTYTLTVRVDDQERTSEELRVHVLDAYGPTDANDQPDHANQVVEVIQPDPAGATAKKPALVFIHGTIFAPLDTVASSYLRLTSEAREAASRGFVGVSIDHRQGADGWPEMIQDTRCAVRYLRANADAHGIDPEAIGVVSVSSSGILAGLLAATDSLHDDSACPSLKGVSDDVQAVGVVDGPLHLHHWYRTATISRGWVRSVLGKIDKSEWHKRSFGAEWDEADPVKQLDGSRKDTAVLLENQKESDATHCSNKAFAHAAKAAGYGDIVQIAYADAEHVIFADETKAADFRRKMYGFFDHHLADGSAPDYAKGHGTVVSPPTSEPPCVEDERKKYEMEE